MTKTNAVDLSKVKIGDENWYKISNSDLLRPFFMSIVSDSNHWMFISSNGGLTAGRKNKEYALFPYYTDDKITEAAEWTGSKSIFAVWVDDSPKIWEPFSIRQEGRYTIKRNLYKNIYGNKIRFEEINEDLNLTFQYEWSFSNLYGFVKRSTLINDKDSPAEVTVLDGIQNILPHGVHSDLQNNASNLVDAYRKNEMEKSSGIGIYSLSAIIVDRAEPSEALKANVAWSLGLDHPEYLLSSTQLKYFRKGLPLQEETDVRAEKGAYFLYKKIILHTESPQEWIIAANVNQDHAAIARLSEDLKDKNKLYNKVNQDILNGTQRLIHLIASADGLQLSSDHLRDSRHYSNTLFNIMRGGIFDNNYIIEKKDFCAYLKNANPIVFSKNEQEKLPEIFDLSQLQSLATQSKDSDFRRLCIEYMPLKFSRRHGDPSRPWNQFSINTRSEIDGSKILDYQGNWRDIFQNWEALVHSYPAFIESMIYKFLNATTFDGYNPYRVTKGGFDWEAIEPDDPWSYIGYWGDHQIIYLLKFLEFIEKHQPGKLESWFDKEEFVYANVPYKIKSYEKIIQNPKDTIDFDADLDKSIRQKRSEMGADATLLHDEKNNVYKVNFVEKILATLLAKLSNFIPEGGIWMNTQRPEWNDANNALVGNGVSMVTLYYIRRFLIFFKGIVADASIERVSLSNELIVFYRNVLKTFEKHESLLGGKFDDKNRKQVLDELGQAGSDYRDHVYKQTFWGKKRSISLKSLQQFTDLALQYIEHSIRANKRSDNLYHAYNLMTVENDQEVSISYLSEMLEGQVAVLSSGYLSSEETVEVLDALKNSALFREDQYSYILYPNKNLPRFTKKNNIPKKLIQQSELLQQLLANGNLQIINKDVNGEYHFNGLFKNADDLANALEELNGTNYANLIEKEKAQILQTFETVFNHKSFTGRSGTFFGYEGLGSIYWHMVSKLQLAVLECCLSAIQNQASPETTGRLLEHYYEINAGIGVHKSPSLYGAFPTDPYSHTPAGKGVQQPGMTGQVKEDILSRFGELGVFVKNGQLYFEPHMLRKEEFLKSPSTFYYYNMEGEKQQVEVSEGALCFTYCQVPIIYQLAEKNSLTILYTKKPIITSVKLQLDKTQSQEIFDRTGEIEKIVVHVKKSILK